MLVSAPPGSGKSRIIVHRVANLINSGVKPEKIMVATFTRKAASELTDRVKKLVGHNSADITCGTFHSICLNLLRRYSEAPINVVDDVAARDMLSSILAKEGLNVRAKDFMLDLSYLRAWMIRPEEARIKANSPFERKLADVYAKYEKLLKENFVVDFDNILLESLKAFNDPRFKRDAQNLFQHILVDEYQDVNHIQGVVLDTLADRSHSLFAVGDSSQAIYGFLGANLGEFREFPKKYEGCKPVFLDLNYRSNKNIVAASNSVVRGRVTVPMKAATDILGDKIYLSIARSADLEADTIKDIVSQLDGTTAILVRAAWQYASICSSLSKGKIKYKILNDTSRSFDSEAKENEPKVYLLTIHAAKGLEFDNVILAGTEDDIIPYRNTEDVEEERRLFYVALTRARHRLILSACSNRNGKITQLSRFLREIPADLIRRI